MKPDYIHNPITRSAEDPDEMTMTIDKDSVAHVMHLLRNNLYRDKIGSPVREYASNAVDAHVEAGIPQVPIRIQLPHETDPYFRVIDQGAGLTEGEMDRIFRRFGRSTKRESNDAIGCLGIGAKSAFAYTDSFMVTSHTVRGNSRSIVRYSIYLDETRLGKISVLSRQENPEGLTGLTVEIPVQPDDFSEFREAVGNQLRFFQPPPECTLDGKSVKLGWEPPTVLCPGVEVDKDRARVIMGGVQYAIEPEHLRDGAKANVHGEVSALAAARAHAQRLILELDLVIRVPIGAVEVDASREGLSYTAKTQRTIVAHCRLAFRRLNRAISAELESLPTRADAIYSARMLNSKYHLHGDNRLALAWRGLALPTYGVDLTLTESRRARVIHVRCGTPEETFDVKWQLPQTYSSRRVPKGSERRFVPVLQDVVARPGQCKLAERMYTLEKQHPGAQLVLYRIPKRFAKSAPVGIAEAAYAQFLRMVLLRAFQLPESELTPNGIKLTLEEMLALWATLGGVQLRDVTPTINVDDKREAGKPYRYKKSQLECFVLNHTESRLRRDPLQAFLMVPAMKQPVVYWVVSRLGESRGYHSSDYQTITRQHRSLELSSTLRFLEHTYGVRCLLLEMDLNKQQELKLPAEWIPGQTWLAERISQLPEIVRYYCHRPQCSSLLEVPKEVRSFLPAELQDVFRYPWVLCTSGQRALKFLLLPTLQKVYVNVEKTVELPEYTALRRTLSTFALTPPVAQPDPLADYPLLTQLSHSQMSSYIKLVHRVKALELEVQELRASQTVLLPIATPTDETETQVEIPTEVRSTPAFAQG